MRSIIISIAFIGIFLFVSLPEVLADETMSPHPDESWYRLVIKDRQKIMKEHIASLQVDSSGMVFKSVTKPDYKFIPEQNTAATSGLGVGSYRAFVTDRPFFFTNTPVRVRENRDSLLIDTLNSISIEVTRIHVLDPSYVTAWQSPFREVPQSNYPTVTSRVVSHFGDGRYSFRVPHLHAGTDLAGAPSEPVYPIGPGIVEFVSYWDFEGTVVVRHRLPSGESIMSKYIHVRDPKVRAGDLVTNDTVLARLFTAPEFKMSGFKRNHLHIEVRKDYSDHGHASTYSKSTDDLSRCCINPLTILPR